MAVLFPVGGGQEHLHPPGDKPKWGWKDLQKVVGGTFKILFPLHRKDCGQVLVVHEAGDLLGLPLNAEATDLWKTWGGKERLRGPVLLVKSEDIE